MIGSDRETKEN